MSSNTTSVGDPLALPAVITKYHQSIATPSKHMRTIRALSHELCSICLKHTELRRCAKCQKYDWPSHKIACLEIDSSLSLSKVSKTLRSSLYLGRQLQGCFVLAYDLLRNQQLDKPFAARLDIGVEPVKLRDILEIYGGRPVEKVQGIVQVNAFTPLPNRYLTETHMAMWSHYRETVAVGELAAYPVVMLFLSMANSLVMAQPIAITPLAMDWMRSAPIMVNLEGGREEPITIDDCMTLMNYHIRADEKNTLSMRAEMSPNDIKIIRDAASDTIPMPRPANWAVNCSLILPPKLASSLFKEKLMRELQGFRAMGAFSPVRLSPAPTTTPSPRSSPKRARHEEDSDTTSITISAPIITIQMVPADIYGEVWPTRSKHRPVRTEHFQIAAHLQKPLDLLNFAKTASDILGYLRDSPWIWRAALSTLAGLPPCPRDLSEASYLNLVVGRNCHGCNKLCAAAIDWDLRTRFCPRCLKKRVTTFDERYPPRVPPGPFPQIKDPLGCAFLTAEFHAVSLKFDTLADSEKRDLIKARRELIGEAAMASSLRKSSRIVSDYRLACARVQRMGIQDRGGYSKPTDQIWSKLESLGWGDQLALVGSLRFARHHLVDLSQDLTNAEWIVIRLGLEGFMADLREEHEARRLKILCAEEKTRKAEALALFKAPKGRSRLNTNIPITMLYYSDVPRSETSSVDDPAYNAAHSPNFTTFAGFRIERNLKLQMITIVNWLLYTGHKVSPLSFCLVPVSWPPRSESTVTTARPDPNPPAPVWASRLSERRTLTFVAHMDCPSRCSGTRYSENWGGAMLACAVSGLRRRLERLQPLGGGIYMCCSNWTVDARRTVTCARFDFISRQLPVSDSLIRETLILTNLFNASLSPAANPGRPLARDASEQIVLKASPRLELLQGSNSNASQDVFAKILADNPHCWTEASRNMNPPVPPPLHINAADVWTESAYAAQFLFGGGNCIDVPGKRGLRQMGQSCQPGPPLERRSQALQVWSKYDADARKAINLVKISLKTVSTVGIRLSSCHRRRVPAAVLENIKGTVSDVSDTSIIQAADVGYHRKPPIILCAHPALGWRLVGYTPIYTPAPMFSLVPEASVCPIALASLYAHYLLLKSSDSFFAPKTCIAIAIGFGECRNQNMFASATPGLDISKLDFENPPPPPRVSKQDKKRLARSERKATKAHVRTTQTVKRTAPQARIEETLPALEASTTAALNDIKDGTLELPTTDIVFADLSSRDKTDLFDLGHIHFKYALLVVLKYRLPPRVISQSITSGGGIRILCKKLVYNGHNPNLFFFVTVGAIAKHSLAPGVQAFVADLLTPVLDAVCDNVAASSRLKSLHQKDIRNEDLTKEVLDALKRDAENTESRGSSYIISAGEISNQALRNNGLDALERGDAEIESGPLPQPVGLKESSSYELTKNIPESLKRDDEKTETPLDIGVGTLKRRYSPGGKENERLGLPQSPNHGMKRRKSLNNPPRHECTPEIPSSPTLQRRHSFHAATASVQDPLAGRVATPPLIVVSGATERDNPTLESSSSVDSQSPSGSVLANQPTFDSATKIFTKEQMQDRLPSDVSHLSDAMWEIILGDVATRDPFETCGDAAMNAVVLELLLERSIIGPLLSNCTFLHVLLSRRFSNFDESKLVGKHPGNAFEVFAGVLALFRSLEELKVWIAAAFDPVIEGAIKALLEYNENAPVVLKKNRPAFRAGEDATQPGQMDIEGQEYPIRKRLKMKHKKTKNTASEISEVVDVLPRRRSSRVLAKVGAFVYISHHIHQIPVASGSKSQCARATPRIIQRELWKPISERKLRRSSPNSPTFGFIQELPRGLGWTPDASTASSRPVLGTGFAFDPLQWLATEKVADEVD
ncbi:hypothetical protein B0H17DRAFT_1144946 [Mycena rosella]|uniref:DUF8205 domain-containing protein n=1 Tax=Mycena rosella TaxID=1033263 RepID=A0AAD7CSE5_MYCRO|nr:hypothetical protein B0H17DRAFT_1144946 [Mycena rosella]